MLRRSVDFDCTVRRQESWIQGKETAFRLSSTSPIYNISLSPNKDKTSATKAKYGKDEAAETLDPRQGDCLAANLNLPDQQHAAAPQ